MANIRKRGELQWQAQVRQRGAPSITKTFSTRRDAELWAMETELALERGDIAAAQNDAGKTTFRELAERYAAEVVPTMKSSANAARYVNAATSRFGDFFLSSIRAVDVAKWRDELLMSGKSAQTTIHYLNGLSAVMSYAQKELSIPLPSGNPARAIRRPALPKARDRRLRAGEYEHLLKAAEAGPVGLQQIIVLAVESSVRLGEALGLEWSRIHLRDQIAHLVDTKNGESRTVALSTAAVQALQSMPRRLDGKVFGWAAADSFEKTWKRCKARALAAYLADCEKAGSEPESAFLADLRFHDLRHEATSRLFEKGLGIMEVASMTGHKSLAMLKRYTHVEAKRLAAKLG